VSSKSGDRNLRSSDSTIRLRQIREEDCRLLWEWANDPDVRSVSFETDPIPWDAHVNWFAQKLQDPNCYIFIALDLQDNPIGQVRFDKQNEKEAIISINISPENQGLGHGFSVLVKALNTIFFQTSIKIVHAFIKINNHASIRTFEKANFQNIGIKNVNGVLALHYLKQNQTLAK
jgi:UDP-2,4-diacetamido-2,4,6-trideoxy-beta-L-altropyranose hydrolase